MAAHDAAFLPNGLTAVALGEAGSACSPATAGPWRTSISRRTAWWSPTTATAPSPSPAAARSGGSRGSTSSAARPRPGATPASTPSPRTTTAPSGSWPARTAWWPSRPRPAPRRRLGRFASPGPRWRSPAPQSHCSLLVAGDELRGLDLRAPLPHPAPPRVRSPCRWSAAHPLAGDLPRGPAASSRRRTSSPAGVEGGAAAPRPATGPPSRSTAADGVTVHLLHRPSAAVRAEIILGRAERVALHLAPQVLTLADDRGRVLVLDLEYGQVRRDLRL